MIRTTKQWVKNALSAIRTPDPPPVDPDAFLSDAKGVIHVGANAGQEREQYAKYDLPVIWIEPIPNVFEILQKNIRDYPRQTALNSLVTDKDDATYTFNISNNAGLSSSIHDLSLHADVWPDVEFESVIEVQSKTLPTLLDEQHIDTDEFDTLIMDVQGAELLVLKGCGEWLRKIRYVKTEVSDFESYRDGCQLPDLSDYLLSFDFHESSRHKFAEHPEGGAYYDILYSQII